MLHSLKKRIGLVHASLSEEVHLHPEVQSLKQKLVGVKAQLTYTTSYVDKANDAIKVRVSEQANFAKAFSKDFPFGPDALVTDGPDHGFVDFAIISEAMIQAEIFAKQSQFVYDQHCRAGSEDEDWDMYRTMNHQLKRYVSAITKLDAKYSKLLQAKSEFSRYSAKFDLLFSGGSTDDLKLARNLQKSDHFREEYQHILGEVLIEQRGLHAKSQMALQMALVVYWGTKDLHTELINKTFEETAQWAKENEKKLSEVNISTLTFHIRADGGLQSGTSLTSNFQTDVSSSNSDNVKEATAYKDNVQDLCSPNSVTKEVC